MPSGFHGCDQKFLVTSKRSFFERLTHLNPRRLLRPLLGAFRAYGSVPSGLFKAFGSPSYHSALHKRSRPQKSYFGSASSFRTPDGVRAQIFDFVREGRYSTTLKSSLPTPHRGHTQSAGRSSKAVPGSIPLSGSPTAGSYSYPQTMQMYFFIIFSQFVIVSVIRACRLPFPSL